MAQLEPDSLDDGCPSGDLAAETAAESQTGKISRAWADKSTVADGVRLSLHGKRVGRPPGAKNKPKLTATQEKRLEKKVQIAVLTGAGRTQREIGRQVGVTRRSVGRQQESIKDDPAMLEVFEEARSRLQKRAMELAEKHLETLDAGLSDESVPLKEKNGAFREIRETAMPRSAFEAPQSGRGPAISLQTDNPAVMASFVEALRLLNEPSARVVEAEVVKEA